MKASLRSLEITTQIGCPLMCTFCPQDKLQQAYKHPEKKMSLDTFTTVLNKLPNDVEVIFAGYTEPWANKLCNQFVKLALESGFTISVFTTLYNITPDECVELVDLLEKHHTQVKRIWVHLPDAQGNMLGFRYSKEYENVLSIFKHMKNNKVHEMTMDTNSKVDLNVQTKTNALSWELHTRANNLNINLINNQLVTKPPAHKYVVECTRNKNFHDNILLPNGDVVLCCMDYGLKHIVGNLLTQSYDEILNSKEIERVKQLNNTINFTEESLCKSCNDAHCRTPWNDAEVYELVKLVDPDSLGI